MKVIINNVRSSHNVGAIFRTADAFGVSEILLCGYTPSPVDKFGLPNKQLLKVSLGAENSVKWKKFQSIGKAILYCRKQNLKIFAVEITKEAIPVFELRDQNFDEICLIVGNEKRGLSNLVISKCDKVVCIPMAGQKESLNVGVAFAIVAAALKFARS